MMGGRPVCDATQMTVGTLKRIGTLKRVVVASLDPVVRNGSHASRVKASLESTGLTIVVDRGSTLHVPTKVLGTSESSRMSTSNVTTFNVTTSHVTTAHVTTAHVTTAARVTS